MSWGVGRDIAHVFEMNKQKPVVIFVNGLGWIASTSDVMCGVEFKLHIFWICIFENGVEICGHLTKSIEVIVVAERNAEVCGAFTKLCKESS